GLIISAFVTASVVLSVGVIPFVGLIIPNIVTIYQGDHLKNNLIHTAVLGALFVLVCDIIGRLLIYPYEIPINLTVGVIGSAIFIFLLLRRKWYGLYEKNIYFIHHCHSLNIVVYLLPTNWKYWLYFAKKNYYSGRHNFNWWLYRFCSNDIYDDY